MEAPTVLDFGCGLDAPTDDRPIVPATLAASSPSTESKSDSKDVATTGDNAAHTVNDNDSGAPASHVLCLDCFKSYASSSVVGMSHQSLITLNFWLTFMDVGK
jgi:hypothetical protein